MRPEDLRGEPSHDAREKAIDHARVDPVEDLPARVLSSDELLDVLRNGGGGPLDPLLPPHALLSPKNEFKHTPAELHILDPPSRRPHCIGLVLLPLLSHPQS